MSLGVMSFNNSVA